ncbi:glyoxalase/bleomycin resistance/extradiol dioxygenase family protein, partial [Bacillus pseudomycoides]
TKYFKGKANNLYRNETKQFESYFITFETGARIEIMRKKGVKNKPKNEVTGYAHLAFSVKSKDNVNQLTETLREAGYLILSEPRLTGDGYYESVVSDPEENQIEITI